MHINRQNETSKYVLSACQLNQRCWFLLLIDRILHLRNIRKQPFHCYEQTSKLAIYCVLYAVCLDEWVCWQNILCFWSNWEFYKPFPYAIQFRIRHQAILWAKWEKFTRHRATLKFDQPNVTHDLTLVTLVDDSFLLF